MDTKTKWIILNIGLPLLPLLLRAFIKYLMNYITFDLINGSELWFVMALICLLIFQDLKLRRVPLDNSDKIKERGDRAVFFIVICVICIFFCSANEMLYILADINKKKEFESSYNTLTALSWCSAILIVRFSLKTQQQFNLTSEFL